MVPLLYMRKHRFGEVGFQAGSRVFFSGLSFLTGEKGFPLLYDFGKLKSAGCKLGAKLGPAWVSGRGGRIHGRGKPLAIGIRDGPAGSLGPRPTQDSQVSRGSKDPGITGGSGERAGLGAGRRQEAAGAGLGAAGPGGAQSALVNRRRLHRDPWGEARP